jgi:uncharacterized glyoxalase superfamily protein PhnB
MPQVPPSGYPQIIPYLYYADVPKAMDWLIAAFGFEKIMLEPSGEGRHHGEIRLGTGVVFLGTADRQKWGLATPGQAGASTAGTFLYIDEVDNHCAKARAAGAEIVNPVADQAYGRTYWARDLEGHDWFFTRPPE